MISKKDVFYNRISPFHEIALESSADAPCREGMAGVGVIFARHCLPVTATLEL